MNFLKEMKRHLQSKMRDEEGATMVEYGLMVALIAIVVMAAVGPLGTAICSVFVDITSKL